MSKVAAICTWPYTHYLDHLGCLCAELKVPLYTPDIEIQRLGQRYYPELEIRLISNILALISELDVFLVTARFWKDELAPLVHLLYQKRPVFLYCPHGQSDKGSSIPEIEPFFSQEAVCVYGDLMRRRVDNQLVVTTGNYRARFYEKNKTYLDEVIKNMLYLDRSLPTIFYGPTWNDFENSSSFDHYATTVFSQVPDRVNLLVKLHPLLIEKKAGLVHGLIEQYKDRKNIQIITELPLVYPLLACCDAYLGDASSIGYDFLYFKKPMFFLKKSGVKLEKCGHIIPENKPIFSFILSHLDASFRDEQSWLYREAFAKNVELTLNDVIDSVKV